MDVKIYNAQDAKFLLDQFNENNVTFEQKTYSGLISPCSALINSEAAEKINSDATLIWEWAETAQRIYANLIANDPQNPLVKALEKNLTNVALYQQRQSALRGDLPKFGRIDSIALEPNQKIAEIQWKGGGAAFMAQIQRIYNERYQQEGEVQFGDLVKGLSKLYTENQTKKEPTVLIVTSSFWKKTEDLLATQLKIDGINLIATPIKGIAKKLKVENGMVYIEHDLKKYKLDYIYLDRLSERLPNELLEKVIFAYESKNVILDPPPSYLYNQKITLALPFQEEYRNYFSEGIRSILIPTALMSNNNPDLSSIIPFITHSKAYLLGEIKTWEDLIKLPVALRNQLVLKYASTDKFNSCGGHRVIRLKCSNSILEKTLETILNDINNNEPWIIQPYINETWDVPFAHPESCDNIEIMKAHARLNIYCANINGIKEVIGSIATFSPLWKVAGKTASYDENGHLNGSSFTDIRLVKKL